jgi:hypothetical protein
MLNGIDPLILFNFFRLTEAQQSSLSKIPIVKDIVAKAPFAPIPIYLSERLTGLYIDTEDKAIQVQTQNDSKASGSQPEKFQKGIGSTVTVNLKASRKSIGLTLFSALADQAFEKVTSKEVTITYLNGAVTVFNGLFNSIQINQSSVNDLYSITLELERTGIQTQAPEPPLQVPATRAEVVL